MSWGLGWKRPSEIFHLSLNYGTEESSQIVGRTPIPCSSIVSQEQEEVGFRIDLDWTAYDEEDQVALKLQSQLMVALPMPRDSVVVELKVDDENENVGLDMKVVKRREALKGVSMSKAVGSGQQSDGIGVLIRLIRCNLSPLMPSIGEGVSGGVGEHWKTISLLSICGCNLTVSG